MAADFLHGVEVLEVSSGFRPIRVVRAAVIGLVGIAPKGAVNSPTLVSNETQAARFGSQVDGFSIPQALAAIFKQGAGTVIVVNVFDPDTMTATVTDETQTTVAGSYQLDYAPIGTLTVTSNDGLTTYVDGTDYSFDDFGKVTILNLASIPNGTTLKTTYERLDSATVTNAVIIGTVSLAGVRTGIKAFEDSFRLFGFNPKILIAPQYSQIAAIATELRVAAATFRGRVLIDAAVGTSVASAISNRSVLGNVFNTNDKRAVLLFPHLIDDNGKTMPYSQYFAGVWTRTIIEQGYQYSPSNKTILGISALEQPVSFNPLNPNGTDANDLNAAGITTVGNSFGTGLITWGNRSASYPTNTAPDNFMSVLITADIIDESVLQASMVFLDEPITPALIDAVRESVNAFLRSLIGRGALIDGVDENGRPTGCYFEESKNPEVEIAAGHITFTLVYMPPTPAERITYDRFIDINFLKSLVTA